MTKESLERGTITTYNMFKGFGFIRREKGRDVFFFYDDIINEQPELIPGDRVEFEVKIEKKGPRAYQIRKVS